VSPVLAPPAPRARVAPADPLSDLLATIRVTGGRYRASLLGAPWGITFGARRVAAFHAVLAGRCWLRAGAVTCALEQGDLIILLDGREHTLGDTRDGRAVRVDFEDRPEPDVRRYGGPGDTTLLVCGEIDIAEAGSHPLLCALPRVLHLPASAHPDAVLGATLALLGREAGAPRAGTASVIARLGEAMFVQAVRLWAERADTSPGWMSAQRDPGLARVIAAMHATPHEDWSLAALAKVGGMSRTVLAERFASTVGEPPATYLTRLRMHLAARALRERPDDSIDAIATRVGYQSAIAFARAFKRAHGRTPGAYRRGAFDG
jgi:AraC-like DNA-binding protein